MTKIVINKCYGGFHLSKRAQEKFFKLKENKLAADGSIDIVRDDPLLVQVVEELGDKANTNLSQLKVIEIPEDVKWHIEDYDGIEWVAEDHRTWE